MEFADYDIRDADRAEAYLRAGEADYVVSKRVGQGSMTVARERMTRNGYTLTAEGRYTLSPIPDYDSSDTVLAEEYLRAGERDWNVSKQVGEASMNAARHRLEKAGYAMNPITGIWSVEYRQQQVANAFKGFARSLL